MGIGDKITDGIASKISGRQIQTINVNQDEILKRLEDVITNVEPNEIMEIRKVIKGSFLTSFKVYDTKDEKYRISTLYALTMGSSRLMNELSVMDLDAGKVYTCKSFLFKGKLKKSALQVLDKHNH